MIIFIFLRFKSSYTVNGCHAVGFLVISPKILLLTCTIVVLVEVFILGTADDHIC